VIIQIIALAVAVIVDMTVKLFAALLRTEVKFSARRWVYRFFT
jgi:hypothetical protein